MSIKPQIAALGLLLGCFGFRNHAQAANDNLIDALLLDLKWPRIHRYNGVQSRTGGAGRGQSE
jgi:hypothetical protein